MLILGCAAILCLCLTGCFPVDPASGPTSRTATPLARMKTVFNLMNPASQMERDKSRRLAETKDGALALNLNEAILMGLDRNVDLALRRLAPKTSRENEIIDEAAFDPVLTAEASAKRTRSHSTPSDGARSHDATNKLIAKAGVTDKTTVGTTINSNITATHTDNQDYPGGDEEWRRRASLTVTQALLRGRSRAANLAELRRTRLSTELSLYQLRGYAEALVEGIIKQYWDLVLLKQKIGIHEKSLALAEEQLGQVKQKVAIGDIAEIELAAAKAEVASRKVVLINTRSSFEKVKLAFLQKLNPNGSSFWKRDLKLVQDPVIPRVPPGDVEDHVALALRQRADLNQARINAERGELTVIETKDGILPRLDFFATLGGDLYTDSIDASPRETRNHSYDANAGLRFSLPAGNRKAKAEHRRAVFNLEKSRLSIRNLEQLVQVGVRSAYIELVRTRQQIVATRETRELRQKALDAEEQKFAAGRSTSYLVSRVQRDLVLSQIAEKDAAIDYLKALASLHRLEGSILERRGVIVTTLVNKE